MNSRIFLYRGNIDICCICKQDVELTEASDTYKHRMSIEFTRNNITNTNILSQSYNASVFYFDYISFLARVLNQLFLPNERSISQASYHIMVLTICFQLFKKQTILWR